jgi:hypothetical protein
LSALERSLFGSSALFEKTGLSALFEKTGLSALFGKNRIERSNSALKPKFNRFDRMIGAI